ncbi:MAG: DoxX family protein [Chitinophagaceae bacterium]|nr:MAG: DoxX family protein [Chitinophagaceae bacterium]
MNQHMISRIAIFLLSFVMIFFGIQHFVHPQNMVTRVPDFLPGGITWVYIVGVAFILAAISFMTNILVRTAAYLLALMLLVFVFTIHLPQYLDTADNDYKQATMVNLLKDLALAAFALYIASNARHQKVLEETSWEEEEKEMAGRAEMA